jgi:quercetin dioxygenase-like cupin family protein
MSPLKPARRIVCGINAEGKSVIVEDGVPPAIRRGPTRPGFDLRNLWVTASVPAPLDAPDRTGDFPGFMPPKGGTVIKYIDFPPEPKDPAEKARLDKEMLDRQKSAPAEPGVRRRGEGARHVGMHETDTVDYAIVLSGEIYAVVDEGETLMKQGDVLIQCGASHSWDNRSDEICRVLFVMIDARSA